MNAVIRTLESRAAAVAKRGVGVKYEDAEGKRLVGRDVSLDANGHLETGVDLRLRIRPLRDARHAPDVVRGPVELEFENRQEGEQNDLHPVGDERHGQ